MVFSIEYGSHITFDTVYKAKEANIYIVFHHILLAPCSHWMLGSMVQLKKFDTRFCKGFTGSQRNRHQKPAFPTLLKELYKEAFIKNLTTLSGFNKYGSCPLDKQRVPKFKIKPLINIDPCKEQYTNTRWQ